MIKKNEFYDINKPISVSNLYVFKFATKPNMYYFCYVNDEKTKYKIINNQKVYLFNKRSTWRPLREEVPTNKNYHFAVFPIKKFFNNETSVDESKNLLERFFGMKDMEQQFILNYVVPPQLAVKDSPEREYCFQTNREVSFENLLNLEGCINQMSKSQYYKSKDVPTL